MKKNWIEKRIKELTSIGGYKKPEIRPDTLKLDSNENYVISKQFQQDLINNAKKNCDIREYPLGGVERLIAQLSKFLKVDSTMIGVGNGSDQILDLILSNIATKQTKILTSNPTFGFFEERCKLYAIPVTTIPFSNDMTLDVKEFLKISKNADILYLDSPNNPTGFQFQKDDLQKLVKTFDGLIIIDEAYGEFGEFSLSGMVKTQENLVVVQTLSKSFGLAGLRLGYFIANKKFTDTFNQILQYPYPVSTITIESAILALEQSAQMKNAVQLIKEERKRIIENLRKYDAFEVFDSKANFVLFDAHGSYKRVYDALAEQGISIRKLGKIGKHDGCLRVTVGTKEMNSKFLLAIRDLLE
ncbi:histidinol-phosphate transaminase [Candidatus Nitrosarchaeum limnium]|uniref:Putative histidinol-phosphate transaminase n=1 Tax=Candidatus Nitrosarchaeum limnium BG20 TaxID=859192 RepID=S2E5U7_9ARCH|nr:histidinol-phosphate transaminase [Candidatus Nitrosarchaeum limnium]EPA06088.1 putative histidinol-phosphate transaminase [Candidatus Nitrosarchaeum limnium BG20]